MTARPGEKCEDCGETAVVLGWDSHHRMLILHCGCCGPAPTDVHFTPVPEYERRRLAARGLAI